jgi:translation initiation factor 2 beta subunit (eIF-2beta)/eIF-5
MSDYEAHKGTLKPTNLTKTEVVRNYLLNYNGFSKYTIDNKERLIKGKFSESDINEYFYDLNDQYVCINDKVYEVHDESFDYDNDLYIMEEKPDGSLEYLVRFYNGGCGFGEALEEAYIRL